MFIVEFEVRDYECDIQGIVNNSVYQNYMQHARHSYLKSLGIDYIELAKRNMNLYAIRIEIDYKAPLFAYDKFSIEMTHEIISPLKAVAHHTFKKNEKIIATGKCFIAGTNEKGRPSKITEFGFI